jgi:hypothetical protein
MKKYLLKITSAAIVLGIAVSMAFLVSCEGPAGVAGEPGADGQDANETCKLCHSPSVVDAVSVQYELSKHSWGEAAFEEAGNTGCTPCHASEAFKYVVANNTPATFTLNTGTGKYSNNYVTSASAAYGEISCFTCHSSLHSTYEASDFEPLTTTAAVSMTMWKGNKTIDLAADNKISNLCVKCHQPRPLTTSSSLSNGDVVNYDSLKNFQAVVFYDSIVGNAKPNRLIPSYRMHVHYGSVGAVYAGEGGVEFSGSLAYENSPHTNGASCQDCHMAAMTGRAGGHTFKVRNAEGPLSSSTTWNFNGCNQTGCHTSASSSSSTLWTTPRSDIKTLLNSLAGKINAAGWGTDILHRESTEENLWAGLTTNNYDGYLDVYDPSTNPEGAWRNPAASGSWTQAQKDTNNALPKFPTLKNVQVGAMINFQLALREYSLGIHNYKYTKALLQNSIEAMTAAGY